METNYTNINKGAASSLNEREIKAFVGKNSNYYINKWSLLASSPKKVNWNFAAFFLSIFWVGYRKMYTLLLTILGIFIVLDIFQALLNIDMDSALGYALSGAVGAAGNSLYLKHMNKKIAKIKAKYLFGDDYYNELTKAGGPSWVGVAVSVAALIVYILISYLIYSFI